MIDLSLYKKIAISGGHGIGKTTLAKRIEKEFGFKYLPEIARELIEITNYDWRKAEDTITFERAIFYSIKFLHKNTKEPWVSDRSLFDCIAYVIYLQNKNKELIKLEKEFWDNLENYYDVILFYRKGYKEEKDTRFIDKILEKILKGNIIEIQKGDVLFYKGKKIIV